MTLKSSSLIVTLVSISYLALSACSQGAKTPTADTAAQAPEKAAQTASQDQPAYEYMRIDEFSADMGKFVGLLEGENFAQSRPKIAAVFTAYEGHADPRDINIHSDVVEGGWTQVIVTQDGLMDDTVAGQQLLAIYDDTGALVKYGMRIKCHVDSGVSEWQNKVCES